MSIVAILQEFDTEAGTTRPVLERVPADKLGWKPHDKSMSLGTLAMHIAGGPGFISSWALNDSFTMSGQKEPEAKSTADILAAYDASVAQTKANLTKVGDA